MLHFILRLYLVERDSTLRLSNWDVKWLYTEPKLDHLNEWIAAAQSGEITLVLKNPLRSFALSCSCLNAFNIQTVWFIWNNSCYVLQRCPNAAVKDELVDTKSIICSRVEFLYEPVENWLQKDSRIIQFHSGSKNDFLFPLFFMNTSSSRNCSVLPNLNFPSYWKTP